MHNKQFLYLFQLIILLGQYYFIRAKALYGENIRPVNENEFPAVVCIGRYNPLYHVVHNLICSGSLVSPSHVLTAEHCLHNLGNDALEVLVGTGQLMNTITYYPIWWISHDQWSVVRNLPIQTLHNDIAVIKIMGMLPTIEPAVLGNIMPISRLYGRNVQIVGCGRLNDGLIPEVMHTVVTTILNSVNCGNIVSQIAGEYLLVPLNYMCTIRVPFALLADGDSGGPIIYNNQVIGVNAGLSPPLGGQFHPDKVNIHIIIHYYKNFVDYLVEHEL